MEIVLIVVALYIVVDLFGTGFLSIDVLDPFGKKEQKKRDEEWKREKQRLEEQLEIQLDYRSREDRESEDLLGNLKQQLIDAANSKFEILQRNYRNSVFTNDYGVLEQTAWLRELNYFCDSVIRPIYETFMCEHPEFEGYISYPEMTDYISGEINLALSTCERDLSPSFDSTDPYEFESYCAQILNTKGWEARRTKGSGDQGCDVIASRGELMLVLQCKLYEKPVGNKAVQEVHAARAFYCATHAAVVSKSGYTRSARTLANSLDVFLTSPDGLPSFSDTL